MHAAVRQLPQAAFPPLLTEIPDPPETLYCRGTLPDPSAYSYLTVVGTRKHTTYGASACELIIRELAGSPVAIVSGLALGIDAVAHAAALDAGLPTVAVPGSGLDTSVLYPATNRGLAERIEAAGGALLSEFPPETRARPEFFPQRNRIMAGLAEATLVIEAAPRSGTLITARLATDYNRDVCAVPGPIFSETSHGANALIKDGAAMITSGADIREVLAIPGSAPAHDPSPDLHTDTEHRVYAMLAEPCTRDALVAQLDMDTATANACISDMEIRGIISESNGFLYRA